MATVRPFYPLIPDQTNPKRRVRADKPQKDAYLLRWKNYQDMWQTKLFHGTEKDARRLLSQIVAEASRISNGLEAPPEKTMKLTGAFDEYAAYLKGVGRSSKTVMRYQYSFKAFIQVLPKGVRLHQIKRADMERFRLRRLEDCTKAGVNADLRSLKAFFSWCYGMGYIQRSPFVGVKISVTNGQVRFLSRDELKALLDVVEDDPEVKDLVVFYLHTGARASEILPPRFDWQNVRQGEITLVGKREKVRTVGLTDTTKAILESRKHLKEPFPYTYDEVYRKIVREAFKKAGILGANLHTLRKTAGALLIQVGVDVYRTSKFLGHSSVTTTEKHYVDLLKTEYRDISEALERKIESDTQMIRTNGTKTYPKSVPVEKAETS